MSIAIKQADISDYTVIEVVESEETEVVPENAGAVVIVEGKPGKDGVSPDLFIEKTETGHKVTVTDKDGEESFEIPNGDVGPVGPQGLPGKTPNIQIGEVITLEPGTEATASITGTAEEPRLNLGIPQGKDGEGGGAEVTAESVENALGYIPANPSDIPTKTSQLKNDSGFITKDDIPATPEVPVKSVFGRTGTVVAQSGDYTAEMVGADKEGKAVEEVGKHNTSENAHNDIRVKLSELQAAIEAFLDIDDPTLDQLSELIQKIEANAGTITELTNGKVNVSDIVNNLATNVVNKPLSAAQGVVLKGLVDNLTTVSNNATTTAGNATTTANEAKSLANTANTNANNAKTTAQNVSDKVNNLEERMDSGEFKGEPGTPGANGYTPVYGVDYMTPEDKAEIEAYIATELAKRGQLAPEFAENMEWLKENGDTTKMYVLPDGYIYAYMLTETEVETGGYTNLLPLATETYNGTTIYGEDYNGDGKNDGYLKEIRLSSSGSISTSSATGMLATGFISAPNGESLDGAKIRTVGFTGNGAQMQCYIISYNSEGTKISYASWATAELGDTYISDFTLDSETYGTGIKYIRISASAEGNTLPQIVTVNEEIKEGGTEIIVTEDWTNTGHAFIPADYEDRIIDLEEDVAELKKGSKVQNLLGISEVFAPSPQLPADGSEGSDFNGIREYITAEQIYAYIDNLLLKYPRYITKEVVGKDESGTHDWCRYTCCRRAYDAWQKPNYPPMYAWTNGSTIIYSVSVSPRIGDTLYTTPYVGTAKGTVTGVSNKNQYRTVGGVNYTRDESKDIEPTLVYTETGYSPYFSTNYASYKNGIYDNTKAQISTISNIANGTLTGANGVSYTRYPLGDRNSGFKEIPSIVIGGNEHGTGGDPATPAMITARMAKDLCECKNADNPLLNLLKNDYMIVFCPVVNPWGLHKDNQSYTNSNGVNLDRNFDTPGWVPQSQEKDGWNTGEYGGSENETQYFENTLVASKCKLAMCNHSYGHGIDNATGEAVSGGICSYMLGREKPKYTNDLLKIAEVMAANYNLVFNKNSDTATPETAAKTRSYIEWIGADCVALEMNSREGFVTDPNNEAQGKQFTARVMEAAYTQLLQVLYMMIDKQGG